jgi:hypothetical protein
MGDLGEDTGDEDEDPHADAEDQRQLVRSEATVAGVRRVGLVLFDVRAHARLTLVVDRVSVRSGVGP